MTCVQERGLGPLEGKLEPVAHPFAEEGSYPVSDCLPGEPFQPGLQKHFLMARLNERHTDR
jgi:hypothetical protein